MHFFSQCTRCRVSTSYWYIWKCGIQSDPTTLHCIFSLSICSLFTFMWLPISFSGVASELCHVHGGGGGGGGGGDDPPLPRLRVDSGAFHFQPDWPPPSVSSPHRSQAAATPSGSTNTGQCGRWRDAGIQDIVGAAALSYLCCKHEKLAVMGHLESR